MAENIKLRVTIEMGRCTNCARGAVISYMLEARTLLCIPCCFEIWLLTSRKLQEELMRAWRAYFQRQTALPFLDWIRFHLKRRNAK